MVPGADGVLVVQGPGSLPSIVMPYRGAAAAAVIALVLSATPLAAARPAPVTPVTGPPAEPRAYILVDIDSGRVLDAKDQHTPMRPASTIKLLTALMAAQRLPAGDVIPVSPLAESMPARKMNVKAGQQWLLRDLMHALLMVSANDAAVAIAERMGSGSVDKWEALGAETAKRLGLADNPLLHDPAGLDDAQFSHHGGSLISARDLAIISRAVLQRPDLMAIIQTPRYEFSGGDGIGHKLRNQDPFLISYPGATGLKTGATDLAGRTFVGSATRSGRSLLAVVLDAADPLGVAGALLDKGFAMSPAALSQPATDVLPAVVPDAAVTPAPAQQTIVAQRASGSGSATSGTQPGALGLNSPPVAAAVLVAGLLLLAVVRRAMLVRVEREPEPKPH